MDPELDLTLDDSDNRAACYRCHPGSTTKCLRGAMGGAVAADGSMEMQCQSCHGNMSQVGSTERVGWFMEPNCQSCHTGTATRNNGQIRYTSVFDATGKVRTAVDQTLPPIRTRRLRDCRSIGFRRATAACSVPPATDPRTRSSPARTGMIT